MVHGRVTGLKFTEAPQQLHRLIQEEPVCQGCDFFLSGYLQKLGACTSKQSVQGNCTGKVVFFLQILECRLVGVSINLKCFQWKIY